MAPKSITEIINVQALQWEHRRRTSQQAVPHQQPVITVSSEYGSQGQQIAHAVAQKLSFDLFDRELLDRVVASANASRRLVESLDNRVRDWITEFITGQFDAQQFTSGDYLRHLSRVILAIGHHGRSVLIGRGSQFILDPRYTLRVRTIAPLPVRIAYVAKTENLTEKEARAEILRRTADRAAFCRLHFDRDVANAEHYDVTINTAALSIEVNAEIVVHAYQARFGRS